MSTVKHLELRAEYCFLLPDTKRLAGSHLAADGHIPDLHWRELETPFSIMLTSSSKAGEQEPQHARCLKPCMGGGGYHSMHGVNACRDLIMTSVLARLNFILQLTKE